MAKKRRNRVGNNIVEMQVYENFYISQLLNIYSCAYEWKGLPESIDPRWLEMNLIKKGKGLFYMEEGDIGLVFFPAQEAGKLNATGYPVNWRTFGANGYSAQVPNVDGVYCYNNYTAYPDLQAVMMFARRLTYIDISIDVNVSLQRFPGFVKSTENQRLSWENLMLDYFGGTPLMFGTPELDLDNLEYINFDTPYVADKLEYTKRDILADALNYIGVQYSSSNKKERLASTEMDSNIGLCESNRSAHLTPRKECAERLNKKYGLNVSVDIREDFVNMLKIADINPNSAKAERSLYGSSSEERYGVSE